MKDNISIVMLMYMSFLAHLCIPFMYLGNELACITAGGLRFARNEAR